MRVLLVWPDCRRLNGEWTEHGIDSFWIECTPQEADAKVLPFSSETDQRHWWPLEREVAHRYFLVARDVSSIMRMASFYPYSGQWGADCPFRKLPEAVIIAGLSELKDIVIPSELRD